MSDMRRLILHGDDRIKGEAIVFSDGTVAFRWVQGTEKPTEAYKDVDGRWQHSLRQSDLHWLAGLFEGEGSFLLSRVSGKRRGYLQIGSTDKDVIERVEQITGVTTTTLDPPDRRRATKPLYRWRMYAQSDVLSWAYMLWPLMGERRRQQCERMIRAALEDEGTLRA